LNIPVDYLCTALGTGGTAAGLISASDAKVLVFPSLKISAEEAKQMVLQYLPTTEINAQIITDYHFGGYGKVKEELWQFIEKFESQTNIPLEQVYTGKMMFGIYDLVKRGFFRRGDVIVALHTGGLQGRA
jgi:1-aminocyclopropane-1-carboxylate deaminase